jgi:hypothetical protein
MVVLGAVMMVAMTSRVVSTISLRAYLVVVVNPLRNIPNRARVSVLQGRVTGAQNDSGEGKYRLTRVPLPGRAVSLWRQLRWRRFQLALNQTATQRCC